MFHKEDHADLKSDNQHSDQHDNTQNFHIHNMSTSQAEIPAQTTVLPMAILERPSLEDSAMADERRVNLQVEKLDVSHGDANRRVAFKD